MSVDDPGDACLFAVVNYKGNISLHVVSGYELSVSEIARILSDAISFRGQIILDRSMLDWISRKRVDTRHLSDIDWCSNTSLRAGIRKILMELKISRGASAKRK